MYEDKKRADYAKSEHSHQFKRCQNGKAAKSDTSKRTTQMKADSPMSLIQRAGMDVQLQSTIGSQATCQLMAKAGLVNGDSGTVQMKLPNKTGLPDNLKSGIENTSGLSMDDIRVHYNSDKPVGLGALAYTRGTDIHVAPGQEKHLPHEAWHVVQQKQGRVRPTMQMNGLPVNDSKALEHEADQMGEKAVQRVQKPDISSPLQMQVNEGVCENVSSLRTQTLQNTVQLANDVIQAYKCQNCKQEIDKQGRGHLTWCKAQKVQPTSTNHDREWGKDDDDRHEHGMKYQHTSANQKNFYTHKKHETGK